MDTYSMIATVKIEKSGSNYQLTLNGYKIDQNRKKVSIIENRKKRLPIHEYQSLTISDLKRKLMAGNFIHTTPGGLFHDTMSKVPVSENDNLEKIGMKGHETFVREYDLSFQYDESLLLGPSDSGSLSHSNPPNPTPITAERVVRQAEPRNISMASEPAPVKHVSMSSDSNKPSVEELPKYEEFGVDIEVIPLTYRVVVKSKGGNGRLDVTEAELGLSVDEILKKTGVSWNDSRREGLLIDSKKRISSSDSLERLGGRPSSQNLHLSFSIPVKGQPVAPKPREARAIKPHKTGVFEQIRMELRIFAESGNCFVNIRGQTNNWKGDLELSMKKGDYERMSVGDLLDKLGRKWPVVEPEGWYQTTSGPVPFNGTDRLIDVGLIINPTETSVYQLVFPTTDVPPTSSQVPTSTSTNRSSKTIDSTTPKSGISAGSVGVNLRIFYDSGVYNLQVNGAGGEWKGESDVAFSKNVWDIVTFGDLKKKLRRWPELSSSGKFHTPSGNVLFSDQDKLSDKIVALEDGHPTVYQWTWDLI